MAHRHRYLGTWTLPSGNRAAVYLVEPALTILCGWDRPLSPDWPAEDITHYRDVTFPEILRAVRVATGRDVVGVLL